MELVYATVIGAGLGLLMRYILPGRGTYGLLLLPAVGAVATAVAWVGMTWAGLFTDWYWLLWVGSLVAATVASIVVALLVSRRREASDARALHALSGGRA